MELVPCDERARENLASILFQVNESGLVDKRAAEYVAKTFPDILLDVALLLTERATQAARDAAADPLVVTRSQLKPFLMFEFLLGKCPQLEPLMYSYFESSSFQPLPEDLFECCSNGAGVEERTVCIVYKLPGFTDDIVKQILTTYFKYLSYNPVWFSAVWNWSELGRFITIHTNNDIRYLAACCLSAITRPTRSQHQFFMRELFHNHQLFIDLQIKHRHIFTNTFKPCLETKNEKAVEYVNTLGSSAKGYSYSKDMLTKLANILLLKREFNPQQEPNTSSMCTKTIGSFVLVKSLTDTISRIAYSVSINRPCLVRGPCGSGKSAILDYVAAHTNRIMPLDYIRVQIGDQLDSKLIIGSYVCTEIPGQFEWKPGPLTSAMIHGSWLVFDDIDLASADVLQVINAVVKNGNLSCVSCCPVNLENPHPDFRLFFTQQTKSPTESTSQLRGGFIEELCDIIYMPELQDADLGDIITAKYGFEKLANFIVQSYKLVKQFLESLGIHKKVTYRDLFKLCERLHNFKISKTDHKFSKADLDTILLDTIDILLGSIPDSSQVKSTADKLGALVNVSSNELDSLILTRTPSIRQDSNSITIGRCKLRINDSTRTRDILPFTSNLAYNKRTLQLLESVSLCVKHKEPVLLVGETGVGKTCIVQHLANLSKTELVVVNLSQQSDSSDLLGGYRPIDTREIIRPIYETFQELFKKTFDQDSNKPFLSRITSCYLKERDKKNFNIFLKLVLRMCDTALKKTLSASILEEWRQLSSRTKRISGRVSGEKGLSSIALTFIEGSLLHAVKTGQWLLLDEINLAEADVLQCMLSILDSVDKSYVYMNSFNGEEGSITIHPNFRVFACMNPSTDIGKKDLTPGTRARFTEFFVNEILEPSELRTVVESYVKTCLSSTQIENIVKFYLEVKARKSIFVDTCGNAPTYSLRTLCRALTICAQNVCQNMEKSLYESLKISFLQRLDNFSSFQMTKLMQQIVFKNDTTKLENIAIQRPKDDHQYVEVEGFWVQRSNEDPIVEKSYIITDSVKKNLKNLARIVSLSQRRLPVLIQGDTSVGKTSLIKYLADMTGNRCYRINNHEHTDLQDYVGKYVLKEDGEFVFQEGLLVRAMKKGYWIILDELNLAPSELLEALNRVLDDNRELFIPETREVVKAHSKFMIFATQNPPEKYAGRKFLSKAFRNRFIELHFDQIPTKELEFILHQKCEMPPKCAQKIVAVMKELQMLRRETGCFEGKDSFMTLRDLFRWAERYRAHREAVPDNQLFDWDNYTATQGLILLEGRVRTSSESDFVKEVIEKAFKTKLDRNVIYHKEAIIEASLPAEFSHICFIKEFNRMFVQLKTALQFKEPVLLCGQTGCGKTTACQLYAALQKLPLLTYNCHSNTESSDFVGEVRPSRTQEFSSKPSFSWVNGPLVDAMKRGTVFLMDEISLADDAVLERLNSILEPNRSITLSEKDGEEVRAVDSFRLIATMNPGGDYGKKELSPALRNRFTEIYCHNTCDFDQLIDIIKSSLSLALLKPSVSEKLLPVMKKFLKDYYSGSDVISIRDVSSWCKFLVNTTSASHPKPLSLQQALTHGASIVFFDQFMTSGHRLPNSAASLNLKKQLRTKLTSYIKKHIGETLVPTKNVPSLSLQRKTSDAINKDIVIFKNFVIPKGPLPIYNSVQNKFILDSPSVTRNVLKIVRAMQLDRPILLEGDPGAGKTSVVTALAAMTGNNLVRINLSEQTDISDLFGSDLPTDNSNDNSQATFGWHDGPILKAIKESNWILLDEMNLASQSVLEGLNACLDHRGEIFIPELNKKFLVNRSSSRIFACQNPYSQGASRKGLPQSFLNRFTSIYIEQYQSNDFIIIIKKLYPNLPANIIDNMVAFNSEIQNLPIIATCSNHQFNLRDILFWCDLTTRYVKSHDHPDIFKPERFVQFVYLDRLRMAEQKSDVSELYERIFGVPIYEPPYRDIKIGESSLVLCRSILHRKTRPHPMLPNFCILKYQLPYIESIAKALELNKMPILSGDRGVGKRSMIKILAALTGNQLNIVGANREMDTYELLGSYEQKSLQRQIVDLVERAKKWIFKVLSSVSQKDSASWWRTYFKRVWAVLNSTSIKHLKLSRIEMMSAYHFQLVQVKELIQNIQPMNLSCSDTSYADLIREIEDLITKSSTYDDTVSGSFEWVDSILIKSIKEGSWLLIENANLLNPATLDRLNPLVEPNGCLQINEKGSSSEGIEKLIPHKDFRLILTMDPDHGELSRAMRNRGVEIFVQTKFFFEDFLMLLNQNGFEQEDLKTCMAYCIMQTSYDTHKKITGEDIETGGSLSMLAYFGLNYITTLTHQVRRKVKIDDLLADLLISFYCQRGYAEQCLDLSIRDYIMEKMNSYRQTYQVNLLDERYKWMHLRHDLPLFTGGDACVAMVERDNRLFFDDFALDLLLKPEEMVDDIDIVNTCITVKIFLDLSTHGDFEYRKGFIKETFVNYEKMMDTVNSHVDLLHSEYLPLINRLLPRTDLIKVSEIYVDTRNSPEIHYYLQALDYEGTKKRESDQNRWLLSLHRIMLKMIVELAEERSMEKPGYTSLWIQSEKVRNGKMLKQDLIRPNAEIVSDMFDLFDGILRVVGNRCFDNETVMKMTPKLFWISFFICKLRKGHNKAELIAICNQIPMLWALTYQKVIAPLVIDCKMADLNYKNKKFSNRIQHISDFLDVAMNKPGIAEKNYFFKIRNSVSTVNKLGETVHREVNRFFVTLVGRYTTRTKALFLGNHSDANQDTLAASCLAWTNSVHMKTLHDIEDKLYLLDNGDKFLDDARSVQMYEETKASIEEKRLEYEIHESKLKDEKYRTRHLNVNRRMSALDSFAPVYQLKFIHTRLAKIIGEGSFQPEVALTTLRSSIHHINGILMSPRYYSTLIKYFNLLKERQEGHKNGKKLDILFEQDVDLYTFFLVDHLLENTVLDNQVVGWTKLRVTTSDLPSLAPLIPEYSPLISLVASYSLDISHLKLNSYLSSSVQLETMLHYMWQNYVPLKLSPHQNNQDLECAKNLIHLRSKLPYKQELLGDYICPGGESCECLETYLDRKLPSLQELITVIKSSLEVDIIDSAISALKLIYFGYLNYSEYAPIFSFDPALRAREKLEVYRSELAHVKLELHLRNTLFYWKTGENLQLNEIDVEDACLYPFSVRVLVARRIKLEKGISKLCKINTNRPKSDDGSMYYELRREVEINMQRYSSNIHVLFQELKDYIKCKEEKLRLSKFTNLLSRTRIIIKSIEKTNIRFRSEYALYTDLITNFQVGMCFVQQGMRCLYSKLEQKFQVLELGFSKLADFKQTISKVFSFGNFNTDTLKLVDEKLDLFPLLEKICAPEEANQIQSKLLKSVLIQLNHHIMVTPSDIRKCMVLVELIAHRFHDAWLKRKLYLEEQRKLREELYQYKTSRTVLGSEISFERQEFLDICSKFPTYDHIYQGDFSIPPTSADQENLETEEKVINMTRSVDISMCIDICKAHYKFTKEAGGNLLNQVDIDSMVSKKLPRMNLDPLIELDAEILYIIIRNCIQALDTSFDSMNLECHLLQAKNLVETLNKKKLATQKPLGPLKSSIEILDEDLFDVYHNPEASEALKFQDFIIRLDQRINNLRSLPTKSFETHPTLMAIVKLTTRISSFLITDPLMKFITGSHALLDKIEEWNRQPIMKEDKMVAEADDLVDLIKSWRVIEVESWKSSLHQVKRKYIDNSLCDLWFSLYEAFNDPIEFVTQFLRGKMENDEFELNKETEELLYQGFTLFIKEFIEDSTLGDYQIRLDLIFSFSIQTRFTGLYKRTQTKLPSSTGPELDDKLQTDFQKLFTYVYNTHRQYQGLLEPVRMNIESQEKVLAEELKTEIRIVAWQKRNLWEIKNNFRISHRKLNKVMNKYLEVLRQPLPNLSPISKIVDDLSYLNEFKISHNQDLLAKLDLVAQHISKITCPTNIQIHSSIFNNAPSIISTLKNINTSTCTMLKSRYVPNLCHLEQLLGDTLGYINGFYSHQVNEIIFNPSDTKDMRAEKQKLCRQMFHSKKFGLQSIFKRLQSFGVSYQRGLNTSDQLDQSILSSEPLRGLILNQSSSVLRETSEFIEENLILSCNNNYRKLVASNLYLLSQPNNDELTSDQSSRIRGYALDLVLDVIKHNKSAALIYRDLLDIEAVSTRLTNLHKSANDKPVVILNFKRVYSMTQRLNEVVGKSYVALSKIEKIKLTCPDIFNHASDAGDNLASSKSVSEKDTIMQLINETGIENSLMTTHQIEQINENFDSVKSSIMLISQELREMLNCRPENYLHTEDDLTRLESLTSKFQESFQNFLEWDNNGTNIKSGTILGSLRSIFNEDLTDLKTQLAQLRFEIASHQITELRDHKMLAKVKPKVRKVILRSMLASQNMNKAEVEFQALLDDKSPHSETTKRKLKPFNYMNSTLSLAEISKSAGDCFAIVNKELHLTDIQPIVSILRPILFIYTKSITSYLNTILITLDVKLNLANLLIRFFTDIVINGFGLPTKNDPTENQQGGTQLTASGDNAGFGEGEGNDDVSKKLEFESQLDELKNGNDGENHENETDQQVPAHDDGVEMSEDIGGQAQGPENGNQEASDGDEEEDEAEEDDTKDLDKELDKVDKDEEQLDEKLWGKDSLDPDEDEDESEEPVDEAESSSHAEQTEKSLEAKDNNIPLSKDEEMEVGEEAKDETANQQMDELPPEGKDEEAEGFDPNAEATEATKEHPVTPETDTEQELMDVSLTDYQSDNPDEADEGKEENHEDKMSAEDGEPEKLDDEAKNDDDSTPASSQINDDDIDNQLEIAQNPLLDEKLEDRIETTIRHLSANTAPQADQETGKEMPGRKEGGFTVYEFLGDADDDDEEEDSIDSTGDPVKPPDQEESNHTDTKATGAQNSNGPEQGEADSIDVEEMTEPEKQEKPIKRTFGDTSQEEVKDIKRQKILNPTKEQQSDNEKLSQPKSNQNVRHTSDKNQPLEVIDLVSSEDEEEDSNLQMKQIIRNQAEGLNDQPNDEGNMMNIVDDELNKTSVADQDPMDIDKLTSLWLECTRRSSHLVYELCQQLQIVLQPTKMSKYKGDYKSGRKLNMRKLVSYIASHYRKDKIWMRRTKASKRTYNITLAVDNSSSMSENNCRQMTYESLALLAKSLSIVEAGSLSVVSFGKEVNCIHDFDEPYMDAVGAQWMRQLRFDETKTSYKQLLKYACELFERQSSASAGNSLGIIDQLLIILSDGRAMSNEEEEVKVYLRQLKSQRVLTLFIIIDDLKMNGGKSLVDVKRSVGCAPDLQLVSYMEFFPFPYYILLRDLETMPAILGNSLRQWFELVSQA